VAADRQTNGDFLGAARAPHQHQVGEVGASNQQHGAGGGHQHPERAWRAGAAYGERPWDPGKTSIQHFRNSSRSYFEARLKAGNCTSISSMECMKGWRAALACCWEMPGF